MKYFLLLAELIIQGVALAAPGNFNYSGRLTDHGVAAAGAYDFQFSLFDAASDGNRVALQTLREGVPVAGGAFSVTLNFGPAAIYAGDLWLEIGVRPANSGLSFTTLSPRQAISPLPKALFAQTAGGVLDGAIKAAAIAPGQVVTSVNGLNDAISIIGGNNIAIAQTGQGLSISATVAQGPAGPTGPAGTSGPEGPAGIKGDKGDTGPRGDLGPQGLQGPAGPKGDTGSAGPEGIQGIAGPKGDTGLAGLQGLPGAIGPKGDKGDRGDVGAAGIQGSPGLQGPKGDTGSQGAQGIPGPKGDTGAAGAQGIAGIQGIKGDRGDVGPAGVQGASGLQGPKGDTGSPGAQGIPGPKGDAGTVGIQGIQGIQGIPGPPGLKGDQGETGPPGPPGTLDGPLPLLDVANSAQATVRAADFLFGASDRHGSPGRAIVDGTDSLHFNYGADWPISAIWGNVIIDPVQFNQGDFIAGPSLKFGGNGSGEGIMSQRTAGGRQYSIDIYAQFQPRITVAKGGNVGIGTVSPAAKLEVNGAVIAKSFIGPGAMPWAAVNGSVQAESNKGYLVNPNSQVIYVTLPSEPTPGDVVRVSAPRGAHWSLAQTGQQRIDTTGIEAPGTAWLPRLTVGGALNFGGLATSQDGNHIVASVTGGNVYVSHDDGKSWSPPLSGQQWFGVACSDDGMKMAVCANPGRLTVSDDGGASWSPRTGDGQWASVAMSSSGQIMAAVNLDTGINGNAGIYVSHGGLVFFQKKLWPGLTTIACSADGQTMAAVAMNQIFVSGDAGENWSPRLNGSAFASVACSADGLTIVAGEAPGLVHVSRDGGVTFTPQSSMNGSWFTVACSADGSRLMAAGDGGISISFDAGTTWKRNLGPAGAFLVACSGDGLQLTAADATNVYVSRGSTTTGVGGSISSWGPSALELQYVGNNEFIALSFAGIFNIK